MQSEKRARQPAYILIGLSIVLMLVIGAFFSEGIAFFNPVYTSFMTDSEYFLSLGAVAISVLLFLFLAHRYFPIKQNYIFMAFGLLLFFGNLVAILIFPSVYQTTGVKYVRDAENFDAFRLVYFLNDIDRVRYTATFGVTCVYLYLMFVYFPQVYKNSRALDIFFIASIVVIFVSVIWSLFYEFDFYRSFFNPETESQSVQIIQSFWGNRNTYGTMVLIGIFACGYLQTRSRHFFYYIIMAFFMIEQLFILSKTCLALGTIFVLAFLLYRYIATIKRHWIKNNIALVAVLGVIGVFTWLIVSDKIKDIPFVGKAYEHVYKELFGNDFGTMQSRVFIWKVVVRDVFVNPWRAIFGMGDGNYLRLLGYELENNVLKLGYTHNGFLAMLAYGGILRLAIYFAMLVYIFVLMIINFTKKKHPHNIVCMMAFFIFIGHSIVETTSFMGSDAKSTALMLLVYLPVLIDRYHDKHVEVDESIREYSASKVEDDIEARKETSSGHLLTPVFLSSLLFAGVFALFSLANEIVTWIALIYAVLAFISSVAISICFAYRTRLKKAWSIGIWRIISMLVIVLMYVLPVVFKEAALQIFGGLFAILVLVFLVLSPSKKAHTVKLKMIKPLVVTLSVIASGYLFGLLCSVLPLEKTRYTILTYVVLYVLLILFVFLGLPLAKGKNVSLLSNMFQGWSRYERAATLWDDKKNIKLAEKMQKYMAKKPRRKRAKA
ncbi:MAG: hypothetical protein MJ239_00430 [Bacilli bacterium]|nr:hypothetical protein [Bacilli bacterium]